jgi:hypothetical protein
MKNLIYLLGRSSAHNPPNPYEVDFNAAALDYSNILSFNAREEYLDWVKMWKEDYKAILLDYKRRTLEFIAGDTRRREDKRTVAKHCLEKLPVSDPVRFMELWTKKIAPELIRNGCIGPWQIQYPSHYSSIIYMLVLRRAGKMRAGKLRAERLASI